MEREEEGANSNHEIQSSGSTKITTRLLTIAAITFVSVWANHESSKGFQISITNSISDTALARRFDRLFIADDAITRMVLTSSLTAEVLLYPFPSYNKKTVNCIRINFQHSASSEHHQQDSLVVVRDENDDYSQQDHPVVVRNKDNHHFSSHLCCSYTIYLSNKILREGQALEVVKREVGAAIKKVTAYAWMFDGKGSAPDSLLDGIADYIAGAEAKPSETDSIEKDEWWLCTNPKKVAAFIQYCECMHGGFTARLNKAMAIRWHSGVVDEALGLPGLSSRSLWFSFSSMFTLPNRTSPVSCRSKNDSLPKSLDQVI